MQIKQQKHHFTHLGQPHQLIFINKGLEAQERNLPMSHA